MLHDETLAEIIKNHSSTAIQEALSVGKLEAVGLSIVSKYHTCQDCRLSYIIHSLRNDILCSIVKALNNAYKGAIEPAGLQPLKIFISSSTAGTGPRASSKINNKLNSKEMPSLSKVVVTHEKYINKMKE